MISDKAEMGMSLVEIGDLTCPDCGETMKKPYYQSILGHRCDIK